MNVEMVEVTTGKCFHCGKYGTLDAPRTGLDAYLDGALVQDAFPEASLSWREQFISGTHSECWEEVFPSDEWVDAQSEDPDHDIR